MDFSLAQAEGPRCRATLSAEEAIQAGAENQAVCLIEWTALPNGLTQSAFSYVPNVTGSLSDNGQYSIGWRVSRYSMAGERVTTEESSYILDVNDPPAPVIAFDAAEPITEDGTLVATPVRRG